MREERSTCVPSVARKMKIKSGTRPPRSRHMHDVSPMPLHDAFADRQSEAVLDRGRRLSARRHGSTQKNSPRCEQNGVAQRKPRDR